jgi:PTS system mannose-specific IID component
VPDIHWPTLLRCFLRTYLVGANFNLRGLQNMGLAYAMDPGLKELYPVGTDLRQARKRYLYHYNTHPWWTPLLVGCFLNLEKRLEAGGLSPQNFISIRQTLTYTLSAIGDSFFGGSFLVTWSLLAALVLICGHFGLALGLLVASWILLQVFKAWIFCLGVSQGMGFLGRLRQWDLINWGQRLKILNAVLVLVLLCRLLPLEQSPLLVLGWGLGLTTLGGLATRSFIGREVWITSFSVLALVAMFGL